MTQNDNYRTHPWMLKTGLTPEEVRAAIGFRDLRVEG